MAVAYVWKHGSQIALEDGLRHAEGDVGADVEERAAEFLNCHRVYVGAHSQRRESGHPRLEIRLHRFEELIEILLLEASEVIPVVQVPANESQSQGRALSFSITTGMRFENECTLEMRRW
jgi:hypothetical protein